jgi:hypothetical protein
MLQACEREIKKFEELKMYIADSSSGASSAGLIGLTFRDIDDQNTPLFGMKMNPLPQHGFTSLGVRRMH